VRLHLDREVVEIGCDGAQISHVVVDGQNIERRRIEADFYVAAMPVERLSVLVTPALKAAEPLLVNTAGSWQDRPTATTAIPNLFLAADFVQTGTDLATMEAANEAARRAVNGILDATASDALRCEVWPMYEPSVLSPLRELDKLRWRAERSVGRLFAVGQDTAVKVAKVLPEALTAPWRLL
jgi:hypothetical protein